MNAVDYPARRNQTRTRTRGGDIVRVGIEDVYWMYPHRDELVKCNIEAVKKVTTFAKLIGREIAGVPKAREILDIARTS